MRRPLSNLAITASIFAMAIPVVAHAQPTFTTEQPGSAVIIRVSNPGNDEYSCIYNFVMVWTTYGTPNRKPANGEWRIAPQASNAVIFREQGYATDLAVVGGQPSIQCNVIVKPKPSGGGSGGNRPSPTPSPTPTPTPAPTPRMASSCIVFDGGVSTPFARKATLYVRNTCQTCVVFDAEFRSTDGRPWTWRRPTIITVKVGPGRKRYDYEYNPDWPYSGNDWVAVMKPTIIGASYNCGAIP